MPEEEPVFLTVIVIVISSPFTGASPEALVTLTAVRSKRAEVFSVWVPSSLFELQLKNKQKINKVVIVFIERF